MGKRKVKVKEKMSRQATIDVVKELLAGLESGEIAVGEGKDQLRFGLSDDMKVSLKGKVKGTKVKVSVGISWNLDSDVPVAVPESGPPAKKAEAKPPAKKVKAKTPAKKSEAKAKPAPKKAAPKKAAPKKAAPKKAAPKKAAKKTVKKDKADKE